MQALRPFIVEMALRGDLTRSDRMRLSTEPVSLERILHGMVMLVRTRSKYNWSGAQARTRPKLDAPEGWYATELGNTGLYINGLPFKPSDWGNKGRPIIRIQNLSGFNRNYNYTDGDFPPDNLVEAGDLLVSWSATLDTFLWDGPPGAVNQHIYKVVPNPEAVTREFLYWLLKHEVRQLALGQHAHGLAMMHINRGPFLSHMVRLPPIVEQRRIVAKVDGLMALCDQLEVTQKEREARRDGLRSASLRRLIASDGEARLGSVDVRFFIDTSTRLITKPEHVAALRETILDLAVRGRLVPQDPSDEPIEELLQQLSHPAGPRRAVGGAAGEIADAPFSVPPGWQWIAFGQLILGSDAGWSPKAEESARKDDSWAVLKVSAVSWGAFRPAENKKLLPGVAPRPEAQVRNGDFLISRANTSELVAKAVIVIEAPPNLMLSDKIVRLELVPDCEPRYLLIVNNHAGYARAYYARKASGASPSMKNVSREVIYNLPIPLPPVPEQRRIVAKVDELMGVCDELEVALAAAQDGRARLLEALLHEALEGEAVRNPVGTGSAV
jgi:type I restriction enzyme, S subunit